MFDLLPMDIASSAMAAQRIRMNALASNLANVETTRTPEGGPYQPLEVVVKAQTTPNFQEMLQASMQSLGDDISQKDRAQLVERLRGVSAEVVKSDRAPDLRFEPEHPDANAEGFVAYPSISPIDQMTNMMAASRLYEANAAVAKMSRQMIEEAINALRIS